jgi:hypothetical protein
MYCAYKHGKMQTKSFQKAFGLMTLVALVFASIFRFTIVDNLSTGDLCSLLLSFGSEANT